MKSHGEADAVRAEVRPVAFADGESENHECRHGRELGPGGKILQQRAPTQAHDIHVGNEGDQEQGEQVRAGDA